jgi:2-oxoglutarate dehydrogenase E2 component (dihydrolipoamide succinyltransferase)
MADEVNQVTMPKLGETVTEGTVGRWLKSVGDPVEFDDPLFEVSTDKVDSKIPSPYGGVLVQILVQPGETVPVGTPLARIGPPGAEVAGEQSPVDESVAPPAPAPSPASTAQVRTAKLPAAGERDETVPLSRIRLGTAERMVESKRISPHVWTSIEVDLERIELVRERHKVEFRKAEGASLTYLPFIARASCDALRVFPTVNSSVDLDSKTMILHRYVNLAIAVDINEQGLIAPVIRDADMLNLRGMARAIKRVGDAAKNRTLRSEELSGSTFTISNPGPLGTYASAAIINQPNVGIITTEGVARRLTVVGDAIAIHHTCILGLSYDHRAFDGVTAARFLAYLRDALQDRDWEAELI